MKQFATFCILLPLVVFANNTINPDFNPQESFLLREIKGDEKQEQVNTFKKWEGEQKAEEIAELKQKKKVSIVFLSVK